MQRRPKQTACSHMPVTKSTHKPPSVKLFYRDVSWQFQRPTTPQDYPPFSIHNIWLTQKMRNDARCGYRYSLPLGRNGYPRKNPGISWTNGFM